MNIAYNSSHSSSPRCSGSIYTVSTEEFPQLTHPGPLRQLWKSTAEFPRLPGRRRRRLGWASTEEFPQLTHPRPLRQPWKSTAEFPQLPSRQRRQAAASTAEFPRLAALVPLTLPAPPCKPFGFARLIDARQAVGPTLRPDAAGRFPASSCCPAEPQTRMCGGSRLHQAAGRPRCYEHQE
jgi:hypothetical protein